MQTAKTVKATNKF